MGIVSRGTGEAGLTVPLVGVRVDIFGKYELWSSSKGE